MTSLYQVPGDVHTFLFVYYEFGWFDPEFYLNGTYFNQLGAFLLDVPLPQNQNQHGSISLSKLYYSLHY